MMLVGKGLKLSSKLLVIFLLSHCRTAVCPLVNKTWWLQLTNFASVFNFSGGFSRSQSLILVICTDVKIRDLWMLRICQHSKIASSFLTAQWHERSVACLHPECWQFWVSLIWPEGRDGFFFFFSIEWYIFHTHDTALVTHLCWHEIAWIVGCLLHDIENWCKWTHSVHFFKSTSQMNGKVKWF